MYSILELTKQGLIEVIKVRTIEEAYDMLKKWQQHKPSSTFEMLECA